MSANSPSQPKLIDNPILVSSVTHLIDMQNEYQHNIESLTGKNIIHQSNT